MTSHKRRRILVTGAGGQLGREVARCRAGDVEIIGLQRSACDIEDSKQVGDIFAKYQPIAVINAAAYTAVDKAESEPDRAFRANAEGVENVVDAAISVGARMVHVSTDYVFDGTASEPYSPSAPTHPLGVYGASKLEGERAFMTSGANGAVVRTAWLYAADGKNFLNTILDRIRSGKDLRVVSDQLGTPTSAADLAPVLVQVALDAEVTGVTHWTNGGSCTWYDFAVAIQEIALQRKLVAKPVSITPIETADYPLPAKRPAYSVLDCSALWEKFGEAANWRDALADVLAEKA